MKGKGLVGLLVSFAIFVVLVYASLFVLRKVGAKTVAS